LKEEEDAKQLPIFNIVNHLMPDFIKDKQSDADAVDYLFLTDLLNFSFWSDLPESDRFKVEFKGQSFTGLNR
jgi:hypothetical protein